MGKAFDIMRPRRQPTKQAPREQGSKRSLVRLGGFFEFVILATIVVALASFLGKSVKSTLQFTSPVQNGELPEVTTDNIQDNTTKNQTPTASADAATPTQTSTALTKENARIKILNGTNTQNLASNTRDKLKKAGFNVASIGNAKNKYASSYIYYKEGAKDVAQEVGKIIGGSNLHLEQSQIAQEHDIVIVMGGS